MEHYSKTFLEYAKRLDDGIEEKDIRCNKKGKSFVQFTCYLELGTLDICFREDEQHWFHIDTRGGRIRIHGHLKDWKKINNINLDKL
jgi:hypothetical protein